MELDEPWLQNLLAVQTAVERASDLGRWVNQHAAGRIFCSFPTPTQVSADRIRKRTHFPST